MSKNILISSVLTQRTSPRNGVRLLLMRLLGIVLLLTTGVLYAQEDVKLLPDGGLEFPKALKVITDNPIAVGATAWSNGASLTVKPIRLDELSRKHRNVISFYIDENQGTHYLEDFTASVTISIEYKANYTDANYIAFPQNQTLTLEYKKGEGQLSDARKYIYFDGAEEVKVTVVSHTFPAASGSLDYKHLLVLENAVVATRYYDISSTPFTLGTPTLGTDVLTVGWSRPANAGNNAIQLEWSWLEDELQSNYYNPAGVFNSGSQLKVLNNGATRVELGYAAPAYAIPMLYDGIGKLFYRVRGVNIQPDGSRIAGPWSAIGSVSYNGHENDLNWQVTTSFAEEGKHKSVIQYYDGSLRPRQTVTKDNETLNTVIAETLYDHEGRPAIQVLPAPGITNIIAYQRNLNRFNSPDAGIAPQSINQNPADYFDHRFSNPVMASLQNTVSGSAAQYYSPLNPDAATTAKAIPDAEGYPYTVTRYTPDGTGRIQSQSGVGAAMKMGSGRETKYYYGSPKQEELDALFGTEVGNKGHYFKNMVQDANKQMSVSYTDMQGRTIATALAGNAPPNLATLNYTNAAYYPNQNQDGLTVNLLDSNTNIAKGNTIESISSLLVPFSTTYGFSYTLTPESLTLPTCEPATPICYECLYDLEFAVIDESGERETPVLLKRYSNLSVAMDTDCVSPARLFQNLDSSSVPRQSTIHFNLDLEPGSYTVRKTLTISEQSIETLKAHYLAQRDCYLDRQAIFDSVYAVIKDSTNCDQPPVANPVQAACEACWADLGTETDFKTRYLNSIGAPGSNAYDFEINTAYQAAKKNCDLICGVKPLQTVTKREMMLADMTPPFGQYATLLFSGTLANKYNIFSETGPVRSPYFRNPKAANGIDATPYLTNTGQPDPAVYVDNNLMTMSGVRFEEVFQDKWAEALLPYHPEYQRLRFAETNLEASYTWAQTFNSIPTFTAANPNHVFTTATHLQNQDPFFAVSNTSGRRDQLAAKLTGNYQGGLSMWQVAYASALCKLNPLNTPCSNPTTIPIPGSTAFNSLPAADKDSIWVVFKNLYLEARSMMMDEFVATTVSGLSGSDHTALINGGFIVHFPKTAQEYAQQAQQKALPPNSWNVWPTTPGAAPNLPPNWDTQAAEQAQATTQCQSYIGMWKVSLEKCPALNALPNKTAVLNNLFARMVEICRLGTSDFNPQGASSVAPTTPTVPYRNFESLIDYVFDSLGIATTDLCNPFIIEFPRAYGMNRKAVAPMVSTIDSCNCDRFTAIKAEAVIAGKNPAQLSSINQYLYTQYGDTLTQALFDALNRCSELTIPITGSCDTLYNTIWAPCGELNPCNVPLNRSVEPLLKMQGDTVVMSQREGTGEGEMMLRCRMDIYGNCIGEVGFCDTPWLIWDPDLKWCTGPGPGECPPGYHWEWSIEKCVPNEIVDPECSYECVAAVYCDTTYLSAIALARPTVMPDFMQCGYSHPPAPRCYTCTDIKNLVTDFKNYFDSPYDAPPYSGVASMNNTQVAYMQNLARFINYKTGMNYSWIDYMQAIDSADCNLESGGTQTVICRETKPLSESTEIFTKPAPCQQSFDMAWDKAELVYNYRIQWVLKEFEAQYRAKCMAAQKQELFTVSYAPLEYHYTLYYYDQAGNLVKTVPPAGVRPDYSTAFLEDVQAKRQTGGARVPLHTKVTQYRYNSLNQVVVQNSPDGSTSKFWYDVLGRLAVSQNREQLKTNRYSYTRYDDFGRITEVGQKVQLNVMHQGISQSKASLLSWINTGVNEQLTLTVYDKDYSLTLSDATIGAKITQRNLRNRVSYTAVKNLSTDGWYDNATFYTYDIHGNVDKLLQDYRGLYIAYNVGRFKHTSYRYDLISGKVNEVIYQHKEPDAFYHRYTYDAENRLTETWTSRDSVYWEKDAAYTYYKHGPLSRTRLGQLQVQGMDYAYTLKGWLKGVNSTSLDPLHDIGRDGYTGSNNNIARDIFGFGLHYYDDGSTELDYKALGGGTGSFARPDNGANFKSLYNGNISAMTVNNGGLKKGEAASTNALPLMYNYGYDQLDRLVSMQAYKGLNDAANTWTPIAIEDYKERVAYDPDGNIRSYVRYGSPSITGKQQLMDSLNYEYWDAGKNNFLRRVTDDVSFNGYYNGDIDHQADLQNYKYDSIGNLISDVAEGITNISWTVYGKIATISKSSGNISYTYDAAGNRITKTAGGKTTLYVRDASGNVMSVYEVPAVNNIEQKELHLYGSSRLGMALTESKPLPSAITLASGFGPANTRTLVRGEKLFELSNHLGNVLAAISDKKIQIPKTNPYQEQIDYYKADVITATDYAPFGMQLFGRTYSVGSGKYRYGHNGQEKSLEIDANGNSMTAEFWQYDARLGRRWNVDPVFKEYESPYAAFANNPIRYVDWDGLDADDPKYKKLNEVTVYSRRRKEGDKRITFREMKVEKFTIQNSFLLRRFQTREYVTIKIPIQERFHEGSEYFEKGWYSTEEDFLFMGTTSDYDLTQINWSAGQVMPEEDWQTYAEFAFRGEIYSGIRDWNGLEVDRKGYLTGNATLPVLESGIISRGQLGRLASLLRSRSRTNFLNSVENTKLKKILNDLFRDTKKSIGNGSSMDARRLELKTGKPVGGKFHGQKILDYRRALLKTLKQNLNTNELKITKTLLKDINDVLKGK